MTFRAVTFTSGAEIHLSTRGKRARAEQIKKRGKKTDCNPIKIYPNGSLDAIIHNKLYKI